jgi:p-cumate 2,3-dioxygenase beta subunit
MTAPTTASRTEVTARPIGPEVSDLHAVTRSEVEDLLYLEAELLDDWDLDTWTTLYTDDCRYVIPCNDDPDGDPTRDLVLIDDNALRLRLRVERLNSRRAHREYPHSSTSHQVHNVRLRPIDGDELPAMCEFTVWRYRAERSTTYVGRAHYRLRIVDRRLRIRYKRLNLAMSTLRQVSDVAIIL